MRILHAVHGYPPEFVGGTELYVRRLAVEQRRHGHEVAVATGSARAPGSWAETDAEGVRLYSIAVSTLSHERWDRSASPSADEWFARLLASARPDVVHIHHWLRLGRGLARRAASSGAACVITAHDLFTTCPRMFRVRDDEMFCQRPLGVESCLHCAPREPWMPDELVSRRLEQFAADLSRELRAAAVVIAPSRAHARVLARFGDLSEGAIAVVPHGSLEQAARPPRRGGTWTPGSARPLRLAHWGHLEAFKGAHVLLAAVAGLRRPADVEVILWGTASHSADRHRLDELSRGLVVRRRERFLPPDLNNLDADVAVFPSLAHESHSFVLDEAFALGLPVIVSARGALPERAASGGLSFPAGDTAALTEILQRALDEPDLLRSLQAEVPAALEFGEHWRLLERVYEEARSRRPPGPHRGGPSPDVLEHLEAVRHAQEEEIRILSGLGAQHERDLGSWRHAQRLALLAERIARPLRRLSGGVRRSAARWKS